MGGTAPGKVYNRLDISSWMQVDDVVNERGSFSVVWSAATLGALWWGIGGRDGALSVSRDVLRVDGVASEMKQEIMHESLLVSVIAVSALMKVMT